MSDPSRFSADLSVERAQARLRGAISPTPLLYSARCAAWLKLENLQLSGAYKIRGAVNAIAAAAERGDRRPVVAASAGNHGKAVAWAARRFGVAATIVAPRTASRAKIDGARALGARVVLDGETFDDSLAAARSLAAVTGARFVHPFDDPDVIAGQGTIGLELADHAPDLVVVPIGGGGLAAGIAVALRDAVPRARIVGAQVTGVDAMYRLFHGADGRALGQFVPATTLADGLRVRVPGTLTRRLCSALLDDIVLVGEDAVRDAVVQLALVEKIVAEGAGAVAIAALAQLPASSRRVAIVSGGNIDGDRFGGLLGARAS